MARNLRGKILLIALLAFFVVLFASREILSFVVDWLFFREVHFPAVFLKTVAINALTAFVFGSTTFLVLFINLRIASGGRFPLSGLDRFRRAFPALDRIDFDRILFRLVIALSGFAALVAFAAGWWKGPDALLFFFGTPSGTADPVFGKDLSFYLFTYPFLDSLNDGFRGLLVVAALLSAFLYLVRGGLTIVGRSLSPAARVKRHLGVLAALFLASLSVHFFLGRYGLLTSEHGVLFGASYADIHARLPMLAAISALTGAAAVAVAITAFGRSMLTPLVVLGGLAGLSILGLNVYPSLVQSFQVSPNELVLERPYLKDHIALTRYGYGLASVETQSFAAEESLSMADVRKNLPTIRNIRLWDEGPLLKTYSQLQQIRTYYRFDDVDNDRYRIGDKYVQVMLSPRELSYADLPGKSWINERLVFTHGFGLAMGPVSGITKEGLPEFFIKDIPPVSSAGPQVTRPELYYGEHPNDYVIVGTRQKEFDYPTTGENVSTTYAGSGGVRLSSYALRMLYASYFSNYKIALSEDITTQSRILYNRSILQRVETIAPFLSYDPDPYLVVRDDGRLAWIIDAYTASGRLPYSKPVRPGVNYIRNPVKIVVDAYDGSVAFYLIDPTDVLARTYAAAYPTLFRPLSSMPPDIRRHLRYPRTLLSVQARMFAAFHMTDPSVFYNKEDLWEVPPSGDHSLEPYYVIMKLPGGQAEEFVLLLPFTPAKRDNLAAWMAVRCDGENYGRMVVYTFPRDRLVFGPRQIDARIDQDAYISQQLTLWGQHGSEVIRGSLLIIPIERSLLYVQPLYLVATDRVGLPELRRVIVASGNDVVMEENLESAIQRLFSGTLPKTAFAEGASGPRSNRGLGRRALEDLRKAREALRQEDWAGFGKYLKDAEDALRRMEGASSP